MSKKIILISISLLAIGCSLGVDFRGFFYSYSTPDSRFGERESLDYHSDISSLTSIPLTGGKYVYSFAAISDIHLREESFSHLEQFLNDYLLPEDLFFLDCGDSTNSGYEDQFITYRNLMDSDGRPWFAAIGNHDLYFEGWRYYRDIVGRSVYTFHVGTEGNRGSLFAIALDSANSTLGMDQLNWLESVLKNQENRWDHIIVFTHSQLFSTGINTVVQFTDTEEIYRLMHLFSTYGVDMVLTGHNHVWDHRSIDGVQYFTLAPLQKPGSEDSFVRISVDGESLSWEKEFLPE